MHPSVRRRWELANRIANCDCFQYGRQVAPSNAITFWVVAYEYWNTPDRGHLIAASLTLDGLDISELP